MIPRRDTELDPTVVAQKTITQVETLAESAQESFDALARPLRTRVLERYPTLFLFLVTFGAVATFLGLEQMLLRAQLFAERPYVLFITGVLILAFTGRLYKKLG